MIPHSWAQAISKPLPSLGVPFTLSKNSWEVVVAVKCTGIFMPGIASWDTLSSGNLKLWITNGIETFEFDLVITIVETVTKSSSIVVSNGVVTINASINVSTNKPKVSITLDGTTTTYDLSKSGDTLS